MRKLMRQLFGASRGVIGGIAGSCALFVCLMLFVFFMWTMALVMYGAVIGALR